MTEVKLTEVIRCSCEAPDFPASSLLQGANNARSWLSSPSSTDTTIEVELQFQKEVVISFLDIGNHGSQSVDILVSHTSREKDKFECLIPTSNFMTVAQSKQVYFIYKLFVRLIFFPKNEYLVNLIKNLRTILYNWLRDHAQITNITGCL